MSKYAAIWSAIKQANKLPDTATRKIAVEVSRDQATALESGVKKLKSNENVGMKKLGHVGWSKLVIERTPVDDSRIIITFSLLYSTDL